MSFRTFLAGIVFLAISTLAAAAGEIKIMDPYFRTSGPMARTGAAFFEIMNHGDQDDRLIAARSDVAKKVELHTHIKDDGGVMKMRPIEGGIAIPAGGSHALERGGDHVMFMGLTRKVQDGDMITVTLIFEKAGEVTLDIPVDLSRMPDGEMKMDGSGG